MVQLLNLMMEDRETARAERQAHLATLAQLTQMATNHNNNQANGNGNGNGHQDEPRSKLKDLPEHQSPDLLQV